MEDKSIYEIYKLNKRSIDGNSKKHIIVVRGKKAVFKQVVNSYSIDNCVEQIVYELSSCAKVDCAECEVASINNTIGSYSIIDLARNEEAKTISSITGLETLDIFSLHEILKTMNINTSELFKQTVIDYITGQQDRHLGNIAVVFNKKTRKYKLMYMYDNGLALFSHLPNSTALEMLSKKVFSNRTGSNKMLLQYIKENSKTVSNKICVRKVKRLLYSEVYNIIENSNKFNQMSIDRMNHMTRFIIERIHEL